MECSSGSQENLGGSCYCWSLQGTLALPGLGKRLQLRAGCPHPAQALLTGPSLESKALSGQGPKALGALAGVSKESGPLPPTLLPSLSELVFHLHEGL